MEWFSGKWIACWCENKKEIFWSNNTPLLSIKECFLLCRPWLYWTRSWNADVFCCETGSGVCVSALISGDDGTSARTSVCSQLHHFPRFAHSLWFSRLPCTTWEKEEGANEILAAFFWFFLWILMKNLLSCSFLMQQSQTAWSWFYPRLWKLFQPHGHSSKSLFLNFVWKLTEAPSHPIPPIGKCLPVWEISTYFRS